MNVSLGDRLERRGPPWDVDPPMVCSGPFDLDPEPVLVTAHDLAREPVLATVHGLAREPVRVPVLDLAALLVDPLRPGHRVFDRFAMTVDGSSFRGDRTMRPFFHPFASLLMPHLGVVRSRFS